MAFILSLLVTILTTFFPQATCLPGSQTAPFPNGPSPSIFTTSSLALPSPILGISCMTGAGDARMDSATVKHLSVLYCNKLLDHPVKLSGDFFNSAEYPTDLDPTCNSPNYTSIEEMGYVASFGFTLSSSYIDANGTIHKQGQPSQCANADCPRIFDAIVNRCEWNSHYFGGFNGHFDDCGTYSVYTVNCTDNVVNPDCWRWHSKWQPGYTPTSSTYSAPTNTDYYKFTLTEPTTTMTSLIMVSTAYGTGGISIVPIMLTFESTFTGFIPNPTYNGPSLTPRFSSVTSASRSTPELSMSKTVATLPVSTFH